MALSNNITAILNLVALMCSIPIISTGIWLASNPNNECIRWIRWPVLFFGLALLLVSLTGFIGAYRKKQGLLALYLVSMFIFILLLLAVLILAFIVTHHGDGYSLPGIGFQEYRLQGFSPWLREHITGTGNWVKIRACLAQGQICPKLARRSQYISSPHDFFAMHLSPIQSGCCKPPVECGFQYSNPTTWVGSSDAGDCSIWSNEQRELCYNCESCKAGVLANLRQEWRKASIVLIVTLVVLVLVYVIACTAYRNAHTTYKPPWS